MIVSMRKLIHSSLIIFPQRTSPLRVLALSAYAIDYVAPGSQEHLLGAGDPADFIYNAFGHASALMQELERAYNTTAGSR